MRVLVASTAGAGHFGPLVPVLEALDRRGADVVVVGPPGLQQAALATGHAFEAGADPPEDEAAEIWERFSTSPREEAAGLVDRELFGRLCTAAMLPAMEAACARWQPELIVREPCEYSSLIVAARRGVPHAQVAISTAAIEASVLDLVAPVLARYGEGLDAALRLAPYLTRFPASLDPSPYVHTRRWREGLPGAPRPLPEWWPGRTGPLVYVTFGSVAGHLPIAASTYRTALQAVVALDARVLFTVGRSIDVAALGPVPANTHVEAWVPQDDVFPEAAVAVCHGGSGTTFGALARGVPLVVVPMFADQPVNAALVAQAGAGVVVTPEKDAAGGMAGLVPEDAPRLGDAVETVLGGGRHSPYRAAAERLATEMAGLPTIDDVLDGLLGAKGLQAVRP